MRPVTILALCDRRRPASAPLASSWRRELTVVSLGLSERVITEFQKIMAAHRGEVTITITCAYMSLLVRPDRRSRATARLVVAISARAHAQGLGRRQGGQGALAALAARLIAQSVKFVNKVNPAVQGGLEIDFGDKSIDLTVASRVQRLNGMLERASTHSATTLTHRAEAV